jgi:hypothetical protein
MYVEESSQTTPMPTVEEDSGVHRLGRRKSYRIRGGRNNNTTCRSSSTNDPNNISARISNYTFCASCKQYKYHKTTYTFKFTCC